MEMSLRERTINHQFSPKVRHKLNREMCLPTIEAIIDHPHLTLEEDAKALDIRVC